MTYPNQQNFVASLTSSVNVFRRAWSDCGKFWLPDENRTASRIWIAITLHMWGEWKFKLHFERQVVISTNDVKFLHLGDRQHLQCNPCNHPYEFCCCPWPISSSISRWKNQWLSASMAYQRQILFGAEKRGPFLLFFWSVNSRFCRSGGKLLWRFGL